jgi:ubiquinone/menaquinone biosynthesis C-methylase UbiE
MNMSQIDKHFAGSIPETYDRLLVPLIFEPYAQDIAERTEKLSPHSVLEVAAGTGVVTRALDDKLPASTNILATDLNQPMLEQARKRLASSARVEWQQADALALPFQDGRFDAVVCQFGAMFFPDKVAAYREAKRVLVQGGRFLFSVWDRLAANEFAEEVTRALAELYPDDPPRFLARTPHGYCDRSTIHAHLLAAGFRDVVIDSLDGVSKAASPLDPAVAYCQGTPLRTEIEARGGNLDDATRYASQALAKRFGTGTIAGRIRALVIVAG